MSTIAELAVDVEANAERFKTGMSAIRHEASRTREHLEAMKGPFRIALLQIAWAFRAMPQTHHGRLQMRDSFNRFADGTAIVVLFGLHEEGKPPHYRYGLI